MLEFASDFETNNSESECRVWAWGIAPVSPDPESDFVYGAHIDEWLSWVLNNPGRYWIHNLGFDARYVVWYLLDSGYKHVQKNPRPEEFTTLIDNMGRFYSVEIGCEKKGRVILADSYKKMPYKLSEVAKAYKLKEVKGSIDYDYVRPPDHVITQDEHDYIKDDVIILAKALSQRLVMGTKLTTGADCLANFRELIGKHNFAKYFPRLNPLLDADIRRAYKGGFVYCHPDKQYITHGEGISLDVNSLYPWAMYANVMPYGMPKRETGKPQHDPAYPLWIADVTFTATLKDGAIPCIQPRNNMHYTGREYIARTVEPLRLMVSSVDWALINDLYNIVVYEWHAHYKFRATTGIFDDYIHYGMQGKTQATTAGEKVNYKLWLNNLYGKLGQGIDCTGKVPVMGEDGIVSYVTGRPDERDPVYIPGAIFTTAYARDKTIRTALLFGDRFCYSDTDSIHALGTDIPQGVEVHDDKLGAWKLEAHFVRARYLRAKTYAEEVLISPKHKRALTRQGKKMPIQQCNTRIDYVCAGMSDGIKSVMRFDDFKVGFTTDIEKSADIDPRYLDKSLWKLKPRNVKGGVILEPVPFTIHG